MGRKIKVFEDSWLKGGDNYKVKILSIDRANITIVCDLLFPGEENVGMIKR